MFRRKVNNPIGDRPRLGSLGRLPARRSRRGVYSMELALVLPIFVIVLFGCLEFALLFFARGEVVEASRAGARLATLPGIDPQAVEAEVLKVLHPRLRPGVRVEVWPGHRTGDVVQVAVAVPMQSAAPDLLWPIGFGLQQRTLYSEIRMIKE